MSDHAGRVFGFLAALAVVWIVIYWWWEPSAPPITYADAPSEQVQSPLGGAPAPEPAPPEPAPPIDRPVPVPAQVAVIPPRFREYTIKDGDTLESVARAELGSRRHIGAIREANPLADLDRLRVGRVIRIPIDPTNIQGRPVEPAVAPLPGPAPMPQVHTVGPGETLSEIAKAHYGSVRYADLIFEANRDRLTSADDLREGQTLRLPPKP